MFPSSATLTVSRDALDSLQIISYLENTCVAARSRHTALFREVLALYRFGSAFDDYGRWSVYVCRSQYHLLIRSNFSCM